MDGVVWSESLMTQYVVAAQQVAAADQAIESLCEVCFVFGAFRSVFGITAAVAWRLSSTVSPQRDVVISKREFYGEEAGFLRKNIENVRKGMMRVVRKS